MSAVTAVEAMAVEAMAVEAMEAMEAIGSGTRSRIAQSDGP